jgi:hypothetical protein
MSCKPPCNRPCDWCFEQATKLLKEDTDMMSALFLKTSKIAYSESCAALFDHATPEQAPACYSSPEAARRAADAQSLALKLNQRIERATDLINPRDPTAPPRRFKAVYVPLHFDCFDSRCHGVLMTCYVDSPEGGRADVSVGDGGSGRAAIA